MTSKTGTLNSSNLFDFRLLSRENHLLSDLEVWHSGSVGMYLENCCSDLSYSTRFLNYEVKQFKKCEFEILHVHCPRNHCAKPQGQRVDDFLY